MRALRHRSGQAEGELPLGAHVVAWGGALLFVASLSFFLFVYAVTFGETGPADVPPGLALAVNVALFTIFALHHSVFARERVRAAVTRAVPAGLERSFYVWVASILFIAVCALWQPIAGTAWNVTGPFRWALFAAQATGLWLALRSAAMIDILELAGVRQLSASVREVRKARVQFKTSGPYGWMRHPIYTGWLLIVFAAPAMTMTRLVFAVVSSVYLLIAIPFEERSLAASSEGAYERYAREVRWKLIPGVY